MLHSISRKLGLLALTALALFILIISSIWGLFQHQQKIQNEMDALVEVQLSIDQLRSQLWVFLQYDDTDSLEQVYIAQTNLAQRLSEAQPVISEVVVLKKMNDNLSQLIVQERKLNQHAPVDSDKFIEARHFLHSRYNMLIQSMTEELLYIQQAVTTNSTELQKSTLISSAIKLTVFSAVVALIALFIFRRFHTGYIALKLEMLKVGRGDLEIRRVNSRLDMEFQSLLHFFDQMKESLQKITITRDQMQQEIDSQTALLTRQKDKLLFLSEHDHLTGLLNRRAFEQRIEASIKHCARTQRKFALLFLDLDRFKLINDNEGHDVGDHILQGVAQRMSAHTRNTDLLARLGGDEFIICLTLLEDFSGVESKMQRIKSSIEQPMTINGKPYQIGISIGVSRYPDDATDLDGLMKKADEAMYLIKNQGKAG